MISQNVSADIIYKHVAEFDKMHTLRHEAIALCLQGLTTVDEVVKVAYVE
jgi:type II secretory ATPase GspE/PulE/Tfp pilus assembly ATPase PilB-like protein